MKRIVLLIFTLTLLVGCSSSNENWSDINKLALYDFEGNSTELKKIRKNWNKLMDQKDDNEGYSSSIKEFKTKKIKDNITNEEKIIMIAYTYEDKMSGAREIIKFKNGYKLSNNSVICMDCGFEFKGELANGNWICADNGEKIENCTRVSIAEN